MADLETSTLSECQQKEFDVLDIGLRIKKIDSRTCSLNIALESCRKMMNTEDLAQITKEQLERKLTKPVLAQLLEFVCRNLITSKKEMEKDSMFLKELQNWTVKVQKEKIRCQDQVIELQDQVIKEKETQLDEFKTTMKTEVKSWSEVLNKNIPQASNVTVSPKVIESAVKKVVLEDDRSKNLMVFGVEESDNEDVDHVISDVFSVLGEKPRVVERRRIGAPKSDRSRPIKVTLTSGDIVKQILRKSGSLKKSENHKTIFIEVDRSATERAEHKKLVTELKNKIESDPGQYHCIRQNKIVSMKRSDEGT